MRLVVMSDSHGRLDPLREVFERQSGADYFLFLGDGLYEMDELKSLYPEKTVLAVRGNCDFGSAEPEDRLIELDGVKIFMTHGHTHSVKFGTGPLGRAARAKGAGIVLFGHTHSPLCVYRNGLHILNPGSIGRPTDGQPKYGVIDIGESGVVCYLQSLT